MRSIRESMSALVHTPRAISMVAGLLAAAFPGALASAQCTGFALTPSSGGVIVPGTADIGNHCDDCMTAVALPFSVTLYGTAYTTANISSNGNIQFVTNDASFTNECLSPGGQLDVAIAPHWDDLRTDGAGEGIFTSISGTAPNRIFNIEWRTSYYSGGGTANFQLRLFEDNSGFQVIHGNIGQGGASATVGVQHSLYPATQYSCNTGGLTAGTRLSFACTNTPIPPVGSGLATPDNVLACDTGDSTLLTVTVASGFNPPSTGIAVTADLSSVGGGSAQALRDNGTGGDVTANDGIYSYLAPISASTAPGSRQLAFFVSDAQGRSSNGTIGLLVTNCPTNGPDVWVAGHTDIAHYGSVGNITAYAIGTDACNQGDAPAIWIQGAVAHPVIAQNFYRLKDGRFEQIGQSWLKHGFSSTNSGTCGTCIQPPMGGQQLGVNCSDAYGAGLNGSQGLLGPRSEVNPTTGVYAWPHRVSPDNSAIGARLQVRTIDVNPANNPEARYYAETHDITTADSVWSVNGAPAVNGLNNVSFQRITFANTTSAPSFAAPIQPQAPALRAWRDADAGVTLTPADYIDTSLGGAGIVARFWVAARATPNGNGTWHYEYAVHNLNADRAGGSFSVPVGDGVVVSNIGFTGAFAHSGEPYPNTAANPSNWNGVVSSGRVTWTCPQPFLPPSGNNANALRWGTLYNFRFDANIAPANALASLGLFKPGTPTSLSVAGIPSPIPPCTAPSIGSSPSTQSVCVGESLSLTVGVTGSGPLAYQWRIGGNPINTTLNPSAATDTLIIASVQPGDAGSYDCVVTNACQTATSTAAAISVLAANDPSCNPCNYDFNQDENIDLLDAQQMAQVFVGLISPEANWLDGDLNGDENADLTDAQLLAGYVVTGTCGL